MNKRTDDNKMVSKVILHMMEILTTNELQEALPEIATSITSMKIKLASSQMEKLLERQKQQKISKGLKAFQKHSSQMTMLE